MSVSLFEHNAPHGEASRLVAFSTNRLDRRSEHRNESELGEALSDPRTRYFGITQGRLAMRVNGDAPEGLLSAKDLSALQPEHENAVLIGWDTDNAAHIAVPLGIAADDLPDPFKAIDSRARSTGRRF
jgi:NAD+ diphosphatase